MEKTKEWKINLKTEYCSFIEIWIEIIWKKKYDFVHKIQVFGCKWIFCRFNLKKVNFCWKFGKLWEKKFSLVQTLENGLRTWNIRRVENFLKYSENSQVFSLIYTYNDVLTSIKQKKIVITGRTVFVGFEVSIFLKCLDSLLWIYI